MDLSNICQQAVLLTEQTARFLRQELGNVSTSQIEEKALNSLVSYVDKTAEVQLVEGLQAITPGCSFLTEEDSVENTEGELRWIVDPLDGTTNFLFQLPVFSISLGLELEGELVLGIVYEVNQSEAFYAWKDGGAYLNGRSIRVSQRPSLPKSLLASPTTIMIRHKPTWRPWSTSCSTPGASAGLARLPSTWLMSPAAASTAFLNTACSPTM